MSTLVLVRHGQASFGASNYDRLSALGEEQATLLGKHWQQCGVSVDAAYSGTMQRQRVTGERALVASQHAATLLQSKPAFNEYDHKDLIRAYLPLVAREHPELSLNPETLLADPRAFRTFFSLTIDTWMAGRAADTPVVETWAAFRQRCLDGFQSIISSGQNVAVFTSGGVITALLQHVLGTADTVARGLNWRIFNASVHRFQVIDGNLELVGFNDVAHLQTHQDPRLLTRL